MSNSMHDAHGTGMAAMMDTMAIMNFMVQAWQL